MDRVVGEDRYRPANLPMLVRSLEEQIAGASKWSLDVATSVLRFYQLEPERADRSLVARTLAKALTQLPRPDYRVCIHLLPERLVAEEPVSSVVLLAQHLDAQRLQDFWAATGAAKETLNKVPGFQDAIRAYVLHSVTITFRRVSTRVLGEWMKLDGAGLQALLADKTKSAGWSVTGEVVELPPNPFNTAVQKRSGDMIRFEAVAPVLRHTATAV